MMTITTSQMRHDECSRWHDTLPTDFGAQLGHAEEAQRDDDTTGDGGMIGRLVLYVLAVICVVGLLSAAARWIA